MSPSPVEQSTQSPNSSSIFPLTVECIVLLIFLTMKITFIIIFGLDDCSHKFAYSQYTAWDNTKKNKNNKIKKTARS